MCVVNWLKNEKFIWVAKSKILQVAKKSAKRPLVCLPWRLAERDATAFLAKLQVATAIHPAVATTDYSLRMEGCSEWVYVCVDLQVQIHF